VKSSLKEAREKVNDAFKIRRQLPWVEIRTAAGPSSAVQVVVERLPAGSLTWRLLAGSPTARLACPMVLAQAAVHHTADPSFECPKCHRAGVAGLESLVVIVTSPGPSNRSWVTDAMDRRIKLPITVFRPAHPPGGVSRPVRDRRQSGMLGERGLPGESGDECGLAHDLRRGYRAAPRHCVEPRRYLAHPVGDAVLHCVDVFGEARDVGKLLQRELGDDTGLTGQPFA
jgi:hypothetical protein